MSKHLDSKDDLERRRHSHDTSTLDGADSMDERLRIQGERNPYYVHDLTWTEAEEKEIVRTFDFRILSWIGVMCTFSLSVSSLVCLLFLLLNKANSQATLFLLFLFFFDSFFSLLHAIGSRQHGQRAHGQLYGGPQHQPQHCHLGFDHFHQLLLFVRDPLQHNHSPSGSSALDPIPHGVLGLVNGRSILPQRSFHFFALSRTCGHV